MSSSAAAFSGPLSSLSPPIAASDMRFLLRIELCRPFTARAGDHFQERHSESLTGLVDDDNFTARNHGAVDDDVDRIADALVQRDDRAAGELHEAGDRQRSRAEHDL